jgi:hypothetical protein
LTAVKAKNPVIYDVGYGLPIPEIEIQIGVLVANHVAIYRVKIHGTPGR